MPPPPPPPHFYDPAGYAPRPPPGPPPAEPPFAFHPGQGAAGTAADLADGGLFGPMLLDEEIDLDDD